MPCVEFEPTILASERTKTVLRLRPLGYRDRRMHNSTLSKLRYNLT
jgi:hypothetical protein